MSEILVHVKSEKDIILDMLILNKPYISLSKKEKEMEILELWKSACNHAMKCFGISIKDIKDRMDIHEEFNKQLSEMKTPQKTLDLVEKMKLINKGK